MYIINCTAQHFIFHFREPRYNKPIPLRVASGQQEPLGLGQEWSLEERRKVIAQLENIGARPLSSVSGNMEAFGGLLYSEDLPASEDDIRQAHARALNTAELRSASQATRAALGFARAARLSDRRRPGARITEVEVIEQPAPGAWVHDPVEFAVGVDPEGRTDLKLPG